MVRHVKSDGVYVILIDSSACRLEATNTPAYAYRGLLAGPVWVRRADEMEDGRFVRVRRRLRKKSVKPWPGPPSIRLKPQGG